jgi:hypothetical protein
MANFLDPRADIIPLPSEHVVLTIVKLWHAVGGIYIWEYFTTLGYEWRVIRQRIPYRWTIWIYSLTRFAALMSVILLFITLNVDTAINCQLWMLFTIMFLCISSILASLLIVIRVIAIWDHHKVPVALAVILWMMSIGFHVYNLIALRFQWSPADQACVPIRTDPSEWGFIPTVVTDVALLLLILAGLSLWRRNGGGKFGLARLLYRQGVVWLILGSVIEIPPIVLTTLHLNDQLHVLFQIPILLVMVIAATRMHRTLVDFASSGSADVSHENRPLSGVGFLRRRGDARSTTDHIKVSVSVASDSEQCSTGLKNDGDSATLYSTSEKSPQITGDPPKLDLTRASAHPHVLPIYPPPPFHETEYV